MHVHPEQVARGKGLSVAAQGPSRPGQRQVASWVWGRSSPRDAHLLVHSFLPSFIHSPRRVSGFMREAEPRRSAAWSRPAPTSVQSGGSGRPVPRCPRPFSEHGQPSGRDRGQVVLSWPAVPRRGQGRRRPHDLCRLPRSSGLPTRRGLCQGQEQNEEHSCPDFRVRGSRARPAGSVHLGSDWSPL